MDHNAVPCVIIQALLAVPQTSKPHQTLVQALPAAAPDHSPRPAQRKARAQAQPPSPRRTRSGEAPEWTTSETLALVQEVAAVDEGWARSVSAFQKWSIVAENLADAAAAAGGGCGGGAPSRWRRGRAASECKRRWHALAGEYGAIRRWEAGSRGRYWEMDAAARRRAGLPAAFDVEVYGVMDAVIQVEEALACGGGGGQEEEEEGLVGGGGGLGEVGEEGGLVGSGSDAEEEEEEEEEEMHVGGGNADACNYLDCETPTNSKPQESRSSAWELANKLQENAQHIHTILKEEAEEDAGQNHAVADLISPKATVAARQKADDLIKSLGGLVSYLNQFAELIKENGFENVVSMD